MTTPTTPSTVRVVVESFGYLHGPPPVAHLTVDVRDLLRNPHIDPAMRELTGSHPAVRDHVLHTPGAVGVLGGTWVLLRKLTHVVPPGDGVVTVAFGCAGGRHRSVALADKLVALLIRDGVDAVVRHRDVHRPVVRA
jgi:RNase adapter protein RapZ